MVLAVPRRGAACGKRDVGGQGFQLRDAEHGCAQEKMPDSRESLEMPKA
jgi:hypothetical protein